MTKLELVAEAEALAPNVHLLDTYSVTSIHELISCLAGGASVADNFVDARIAAFKAINPKVGDFENFWSGPVHPRIWAELDALKTPAQASTTVFGACEYVAKNNGWGRKQEAAMKSASVADSTPPSSRSRWTI